MSINSIYTTEEKKIRRDLLALRERQSYYRKMWLDLDVKVEILKGKLNGKYDGNKYIRIKMSRIKSREDA